MPLFKPLTICFLLMCTSFQLLAQQESQYSLFMFNPMAYNPAYAGMDFSLSATGVFRRQWVDLDFTPTTQQVNVHSPIPQLFGGVGISFDNDQYGAEQMTRFGLAYAYQLSLGEGVLSLGAQANITQRSLNGSLLRTPGGTYSDGSIDHNDPILPLANESGSSPAFDLGVYYQQESWELGIGVRNITESATELNSLAIRNVRNFSLSGKADINLTSILKLSPYLLIQSDGVQTQTSIAAIAEYNDNIFLGAAFRGYNTDSRDAVAIIGGFRISPKLKLAYAYDVTISGLKQVTSGSHEILLNYNLNQRYVFSKPPNTIYHPRAF